MYLDSATVTFFWAGFVRPRPRRVYHFAGRRGPPSMSGGEDAGGDVRSEDDGADIRWTHPDALRAAVLTANGIHARARWETKQGVNYSTFRFALKDASRAKLRRAPESIDGTQKLSPSATTPAPARTRFVFSPAPVANPEAWSENASRHARRVAESRSRFGGSPDERVAAPRVVRWSRGDESAGAPAKIALGRADGGLDILTPRETRVATRGGASTVGYRLDATHVLDVDGGDDAKRYASPVVDADWSAAGDRLVTACEAGYVRVWSRVPASETTRNATNDAKATKNTPGHDEGDKRDPARVAPSRGAETWRCSRVVACGIDGDSVDSVDPVDPVDPVDSVDSASATKAPRIVAARFHPLNAETVFVARRKRSVWVLNAGTGRVSARLATRMKHAPADFSAVCVDAVGSHVYVGDTEGRVLALRYTRADANRGSRFAFAARRDAGVGSAAAPTTTAFPSPSVPSEPNAGDATAGRGDAAERPAERCAAETRKKSAFASRGGPGPRSSGLASFASFSPKRGGEHAVTLVGGAAPPADVARGDGSGISGVSYAPYARAAGGAAVFATFRCGAVRVYKTTFGVAESAPTRRNGHATHPAFRKSRGALMPTLTATFPSWPGVSRTLSTFIAVAPARDPLGAAECCASVFGGGAATYALPSVASAPPARVGALAAEGNRAAVCAAFDAAAETLVVGYEDGGVLLWRRVAA